MIHSYTKEKLGQGNLRIPEVGETRQTDRAMIIDWNLISNRLSLQHFFKQMRYNRFAIRSAFSGCARLIDDS